MLLGQGGHAVSHWWPPAWQETLGADLGLLGPPLRLGCGGSHDVCNGTSSQRPALAAWPQWLPCSHRTLWLPHPCSFQALLRMVWCVRPPPPQPTASPEGPCSQPCSQPPATGLAPGTCAGKAQLRGGDYSRAAGPACGHCQPSLPSIQIFGVAPVLQAVPSQPQGTWRRVLTVGRPTMASLER